MHIAIDARIINSSTGRYVERLLHYLQTIDTTTQYTVLVRAKDSNYWKPTADNFTVKVAEYDNYSFAEQIGFKKFLDELHADIVHFCMPQQPIFYTGKHITTVHDLSLLKTYNSDKNWLIFHLKQLVGRFVFRRVIKSSSQIITISEYTKKDILDFVKIPKEKISITLEAADIFVDKIRPYDHPFKRFILYVGQQSDYKNIKRLGDAHQKLLETYPDLGLILVGKKNASVLKNESYFTRKNYTNILFTDFIEDNQRDWLYTQCAAYIFPSLLEGFGLPGLEAMGYGAPVVSSNATSLPEIYQDAAIYFDPRDTDDMARAISEVLSNESLRQALIVKGSSQVRKYSWERMAQQTHSVYMKALQKD